MIGRRASLLAALLASTTVISPSARAQERDAKVAEVITVFEAQIAIDTSNLGPIDRQRLKPDQILLLEGGLPRQVTNIQPLGSGGWRILLYFDAPTSRARTVKLAAQRLGRLAQELTDLGSVEVVIADPEPRTVLEASREPVPLADRLAQIASSEAGSDRIKAMRQAFTELEPGLAPSDPRRREALDREIALAREQVDRLILRVARGCEGDPCALFVISDGFYEDPASFYLGEHRLAGIGETRPLEQAAEELAQTVAGYEWIAFPLPVREDRIETPVVAKPRSDFDVFLDHTGAVRRAPKASDREPAIDLEKLEVTVTPILQPLVKIAAGSGGAVLRVVDDIAQPLDTLPARRRVYYLTDRPLDGDPRPVSARMAQSGAVIATPSWIRSSTPPSLAAARVRAILAGRKLEDAAPLQLQAKLEREAAGQATLMLDTRWAEGQAPPPQSLIRVSVGYARPGDVPWVGHQRVRAGALGEGGAWQHRLALSLPDGVGPVAVVVEGLVPRAWGTTLVESR
jgi:hypothetical protein